jgi:hypothetical protein
LSGSSASALKRKKPTVESPNQPQKKQKSTPLTEDAVNMQVLKVLKTDAKKEFLLIDLIKQLPKSWFAKDGKGKDWFRAAVAKYANVNNTGEKPRFTLKSEYQ